MMIRPVWVASALMILSGLAGATSFVDQPLPDTVKDAPVIVRGKVTSTHSDWGMAGDGGKQIFTFYGLQVAEVFKGEIKGKSIQIREMGGEKDGVGMHVSGASRFQKDEDVVVLLGNRNAEGSYDVRGLMMGKFNIVQDQSGKEVLSGPALIHHTDGTGGHTGSGEEQKWTLEALRDLIRSQQGPSGGPLSPQNRTGLPQPSNTPEARPEGKQAASSAAPQLQNSPPEGTGSSSENGFPGWLGLALVGLGVFATWAAIRRFRK